MEHVSELMQEPDVVIEHDKPVSALLGKLSSNRQPAAVITRDGKYAGMLDVFGLLRSRIDISSMKVSSLLENAPTLAANDTLLRAGELFTQTPLRSLAVLKKDSVVGVITQEAVQEVLGAKDMDMSVRIASDANLGALINTLRENKSYAVWVYESDTPVGVVTLGALLERYYSQHQTRDQGMRPNQKTKAFTAENSSVLNLPVDSLMEEVDERTRSFFVSNAVLGQIVADRPDRQLSFVGLDKLDEVSKLSVHDLFSELYDKLLVHERYSLKIHIKTYHDEGNQQKVSVHAHAETVHGDKMEATADEWGLEAAARSVMDKLEWQIRKLSEQ